jgi:hypothetical protein
MSNGFRAGLNRAREAKPQQAPPQRPAPAAQKQGAPPKGAPPPRPEAPRDSVIRHLRSHVVGVANHASSLCPRCMNEARRNGAAQDEE